jgi:hypothetical protein
MSGRLIAERRYRVATIPWNAIMRELRYDRGLLTGSERFAEMSGIEQCESLKQIDEAIKNAQQWLDFYESKRHPRAWSKLFTKKYRVMTDEEVLS